MNFILRMLALICLGIVLATDTASAQSVVIGATANIFAAGQADTGAFGGGTVPVEIAVFGASSITIQQVVGTVSFGGGFANGPDGCGGPLVGPPDGCAIIAPTILNAPGSISGITHQNKVMFLSGVFVGPAIPSGSPPGRIVFNDANDEFETLAPLLNQTFFVGDGLSNGSLSQLFEVPIGATRLFLGFADGFDFEGDPSLYYDNTGFFNAAVSEAQPVPSMHAPALGIAILILILVAREKINDTLSA